MENAPNIPAIDNDKLNLLSAEVRFIRAYLYSRLIMLYGDVPLVTNSIDDILEGNNLSRTDMNQIWNFITDELSWCSTVLPEKQNEKGRITKGAALSLLGRSYLYQGKWQEAAKVSKSVMGMKVYKIYDSYKNLFAYEGENNIEVILDKQHIKDSYSNNVFSLLAPFSIKKQGPTFVPTKKIYDAYRMNNGLLINENNSGFSYETQYENRDPRLYYSIFLPGDTLPDGNIYNPIPGEGGLDEVGSTYLATSLGFNIKKYINKEDVANPSNCGINIILIRYAEVLLNYAEAKIELNDIDDSVFEAINEIRRRKDVNMPDVDKNISQAQLLELVRNERMVELAFEGHRLFDCRRWKTAEKEFPGIVEGIVYKNNDGDWITVQIGGFTKVFNPDKHYLWPIPQKEIDLNKNFVQNPNW